MERFFCTAGPVQSDINYFIDPLGRVEVAEMEDVTCALGHPCAPRIIAPRLPTMKI